jgi:hypothetical protein
VRRLTTVVRPVLPRQAVVGQLARFALLPCGVPGGTNVTSDLEAPGCKLGPFDTQQGSRSPAFADEAVVPNDGVLGR